MAKLLQRLLLLLALALGLFQASAQTNLPAGKPPANRYLLLVETSRAMQRRTNGLWQTVQDLVRSGMSGQMRPGDSLGLWTYNEQLQAGAFPLQEWAAESPATVPARVLAFLQAQSYEKQAHFEAVLPALQQVVQRSEYLTTVLVLTGEETVQGVPFAEKINDYCKAWQKQQQEAAMPFVVVLRSEHGRLVDYSLNSPPWPVEFPALPAELTNVVVVTKAAPVSKPASVPTPAARILPPLILSGKKAEAVPPSKPVQLTAETAGQSANPAELATRPAPSVPAKSPETAQSPSVTPSSAEGKSPAPAAPVVDELTPKPEGPSATQTRVVPPPNRQEMTPKRAVESGSAAVVGSNGSLVIQSATAPVKPRLSGLNFLVLAAVGGGVLMLTSVVLLRRRRQRRKPQHVSLITQSLDQRKRF